MMARCLILILVMAFPAGRALAESIPRPGHLDPRIRSVVYNPNNVTAIDARLVRIGERAAWTDPPGL